ncbi:MAG: hypothetical protein C4293_12160, partial [Nitrospiraceae bacterium]
GLPQVFHRFRNLHHDDLQLKRVANSRQRAMRTMFKAVRCLLFIEAPAYRSMTATAASLRTSGTVPAPIAAY